VLSSARLVKRSFKETTNRVEIGIANGGANNNNPDLDIADLPVDRMLARPIPSPIRVGR
jgi:hypothetical protein